MADLSKHTFLTKSYVMFFLAKLKNKKQKNISIGSGTSLALDKWQAWTCG